MRAALLALFLCSCSMVGQTLNPDVVYPRDIEVTVNGQHFMGTGVPAKADKYEMEIKAKGVINKLIITTCHRDVEFEFDDPGWFSKGNVQKWTYIPVKGLEDGKGCVMEIGAFEVKKGRHGWAMLDFYDGFTGVPATLQCNGSTRAVGPVSICQARSGLMQRIVFDHRMKVAPDRDECKVFRTKDEMTYEFQMPDNTECTYYFGDKDGHFHRLTLVGFTGTLLRTPGE